MITVTKLCQLFCDITSWSVMQFDFILKADQYNCDGDAALVVVVAAVIVVVLEK